MGVKMRVPEDFGGISFDGVELKIKTSKGVRYVEVDADKVSEAESHGLAQGLTAETAAEASLDGVGDEDAPQG